jgi:Amt family ammonium transporter
MDLIYFRKPSVIGAIQGMITGLVAITPAAGFVAGKQDPILSALLS